MYNTDLPTRADLPSSARLRRSTFIAATIAAILLVTIVLPAEYGVDPLRIGRVFGLTQMGAIKVQLAEEAAADAAGALRNTQQTANTERLDLIDERLDAIIALLDQQPTAEVVRTQNAPAQEAAPAPDVAALIENAQPAPVPVASPPNEWSDEISIKLAPGEGVEFKLVMAADAEAEFYWSANGAVLNFDAHGDGGGQSVSYEKGRNVAEDRGVLRAAFEGNHGWFFRNRTEGVVTLTLRTRGDYLELKRTV